MLDRARADRLVEWAERIRYGEQERIIRLLGDYFSTGPADKIERGGYYRAFADLITAIRESKP